MAGYIGSKASVVSSGAERKKTFAITTSTTALTGLSYTPTKVHVFHNGVRLVDGTDFTATNGTSITLTVAAESGDQVVVVSYASFQVADAYTQTEADAEFVAKSGDTMTGPLSVTGTVTADGLTSASVLTLSSAFSSGSLGGIIRLADAGTQFGDLHEDSGNFLISSAQVDKDIIFKGNDGGSVIEAMRIDMSSGGNVGIGAAAANSRLYVSGSGFAGQLLIAPTTSAYVGIGHGTDDPAIHWQTGDFRFATSTASDLTGFSEKMRITNAGNLLVGKTANDIATVGHRLGGGGSYAAHSRANEPALYVNRNSSDGNVLTLTKDGSTVGSIGTANGAIYIASPDGTDAGLRIGNSYVAPVTTSGAFRDNAIDMGHSSSRFKDVHAVNFIGDGSGLTGVGASTAFGAVGTYYIGGWLLPSYTHIAGGSTVAGSGIYDEGVSSSVDRRPLKDFYSNRTLAGLSGTWRIMSGPISNYPQDVNGTLFVRIA